ncbi:hypothetical protein EIP86_006956 [Pleurotus ostreatoroseus]|nr:hypothetical protein EIP86_006956 [Pleurotus ostreatoroseus]
MAEYERRTFLAGAALHPPADADSARDEERDALATFRGEQERLGGGLRRVLQRKVDKSRVGDGLVADVRTLVDEMHTVATVF